MVKDDKATYAYDAFNRNTRVETFDGNIQIDHYDAEGLRAEMEENGRLAAFIFNPAKEVVTETEDRTVLRYIRGSELIARNTDAVRTYYHYASDEMGSITHVTDEEGNILNRYEYDAWGNLTAEDEQVSNRFKYTGEQFDAITQQYYLRARFYNPSLARFMQEDTYRGDGLNLYTYCANNPVRYVDPSGHEKTVSFSDKLEGHVAEEIEFAKEHGVFVYYDTPLANKVNEIIKQNQPQTPKADMPNDGRRDEGGSKSGGNTNKLFKNQSLLDEHYGKHGQEIAYVLGDSYYSIDKYLDDANYIINNGTYAPELNGYVSFMRGKKYGFVGLDRTTGDITTFHIKNISELIKKAPSLGFER